MKRIIKFRAWDPIENEMDYDFQNTVDWEFKDNYELMQFTCLKDKNGKEIYEGDIIQFSTPNYDPDCPVKTWVSVVVYDEDEFTAEGMWARVDDKQKWDEVEIIGNIYSTPELLNDKKMV